MKIETYRSDDRATIIWFAEQFMHVPIAFSHASITVEKEIKLHLTIIECNAM